MANTIKLKRGSGSDPGASDLSVGEIAIRTDSGKLFTKKDDGSVAEISGSGGIDDGDKGDITVSNSGGTFTIDNGVVTSAKILDGTIVNGDIAAGTIGGSRLASGCIDNSKVVSTAAIDGSKISPAFTSDITGTGDLTLTSTDTGSSASPIIELYRNSASPADADYLGQLKFTGESDDGSKEVYAKITGKIDDASSGTEDGIIEIAHRKDGSNNISARFTSETLKLINGTGLEVAGDTTLSAELTINTTRPRITLNDTDSESDFEIKNENGSFRIRDIDNPTDRYKINTSGTVHEFLGSAGFSSTLNVVSNLTVGGSVTAPRISGSNGIMEMKAEIGTSQTLTSGYNAISVDPTVANGVTVTVPSGAVWSIV